MSESEKPEETLTEEELEILGQVLDNIVSGAAGPGLAADVEEQLPAEELAAEGKILLALQRRRPQPSGWNLQRAG